MDSGTQSDKDLVYGWITGAWSASTLFRSDQYDAIIGRNTGDSLVEGTLNACRQNGLLDLLDTFARMLNDMPR